MELRLLRMFCSVAKHASVVAASRELHLTPSAISHGLKLLENQLGCRLFERAGKKMLLNHAGEQFLAKIQQPLAWLDEAEGSMKEFARSGNSRLRIGAAASACEYILPSVIRELKKAYPGLALQIELGDMDELAGGVRENRIDLLLGIAGENTGLHLYQVFEDELMFTFAPNHRWASLKTLSREELRTEPLILYKRTSFTAQLIQAHFRSLEIAPSTIMEIGSINAIKELIRLGLGVGVLAPWSLDRELLRGRLRVRPVSSKPLRRQWVIGYLPGRILSPVEEAFCRFCRNHATALRLDRHDIPNRPLKGG